MTINKTTGNSREAKLSLTNQPPMACTILQVSPTEISVKLLTPDNAKTLTVGLPADLLVKQLDSFVINTSITELDSEVLTLKVPSKQQSQINQLRQWFDQTPIRSPRSKTHDKHKILSELTSISIDNVSGLYQTFLAEADNRLFNMAEVAASNDDQNKLFTTKTILRKQGQQLLQDYRINLESTIKSSLRASQPNNKEAENNHEEMALVDLKEFEDRLTQETIVKKANQKYYQPLACLEKRYGELLNRDISGSSMPASIENLADSLQKTLTQHDVDPSVLPIIYQLFDDTVINRLDDLFDTLNNKLKSHGILPNIESQLLTRRPQSVNLATTGQSSDGYSTNDGDTSLEQASSSAAPSELFNTARNLLQLARPDHGLEAATLDQSLQPIDTEEIINQLSTLQHDLTAATNIDQQAPILETLQKGGGVISQEHSELINLVDTIFKTVSQYSQIPASITSSIKQLEVPVVKAALLDESFFTSPNHPATQLLNQIINLCLKTDMPNQTLEKKLEVIASQITQNFEQDLSIFTRSTEELALTESQQKNAAQRNTMRVAQTYSGRQQVENAKNAVNRELNRRISAPEAPEVIIDLIENGWRELLNLTYIREGKNSEPWYENISTLDQLQLWISGNENDDSLSLSTMEKELEADSFADLIGQKLNNFFPADYRYQSTVENIRAVLKGQQPVKMVQLSEDPYQSHENFLDLDKEILAANPHLNRWFKQAKNLKSGDEFTYLDDPTGERNLKLAWVSDNHQHYVFVNNRGQKVVDFDLVDLANELSKGLSLQEKKQQWPLVESSLYSTVQQAYEKLAFKSTHDELTGLISRKECERLLDLSLLEAKNHLQTHCLLYLDIDNFSLTNNLHGHVAGDQLLIDLSNILSNTASDNTLIARMAGNEFVILLKDKSIENSLKEANLIRKAVEDHAFTWDQHKIELTISAGLITINKFTGNVVDVLRDALSACQDAKKRGGNRIQEFRLDETQHERRTKLLSWIDQLGNILNSGKMVLRGQKISSINGTKDDFHYEILLGIKNDKGELSSPVEFIEAAECYNRMQRVDRWVIENTFKWLNSLQKNGVKLPKVSINLSGNSINDDQFVDYILEQFAQYNIPTSHLCFEVTETATINNLSEAADFIRNIKKLGCKFSLDDFGSGNASYQYLKHLPVDYLKIDGMFVKDIDKNLDDYALVKSINDIAHLMGKKTIAEYAETQEIVEVLKEIGVDYVQGYAIDMPTPLDDINLGKQH